MKTDGLNLGQLIEGEQQRDAIHIAVAPVEAGETLQPGSHVGILADGSVGDCDNPIGIIDPFLERKVRKSEKCWLFLYPNTVTGLRHDWTHPAFIAKPYNRVSESEQWLRCYATRIDVDYDELMANAGDAALHGAYWSEGGRFEGMSVEDEFWDHWEIVTGRKAIHRIGMFSCSC